MTSGCRVLLQMGEELLDDGSVMFQMRTGNNYTATLTARSGSFVVEQHECVLLRVVLCIIVTICSCIPSFVMRKS